MSLQSFLGSYFFEGLEGNKNIEDHKTRRFFSFYIDNNNKAPKIRFIFSGQFESLIAFKFISTIKLDKASYYCCYLCKCLCRFA